MALPCIVMYLDTDALIIFCAIETRVCVTCDVHDRAFLTLGSESHSATGITQDLPATIYTGAVRDVSDLLSIFYKVYRFLCI
jgi:hypothetical protein